MFYIVYTYLWRSQFLCNNFSICCTCQLPWIPADWTTVRSELVSNWNRGFHFDIYTWLIRFLVTVTFVADEKIMLSGPFRLHVLAAPSLNPTSLILRTGTSILYKNGKLSHLWNKEECLHWQVDYWYDPCLCFSLSFLIQHLHTSPDHAIKFFNLILFL